MSIWDAVFWGAFSSASLYIGAALAGPMANRERLTGQVMGFGAGAMISAVAYELIPLSSIEDGWRIGAAFLAGAIVYFVADHLVDSQGGKHRQEIDADKQGGSGAAMFLGALLDGVPEALVLGITLSLGGSISLAFVAAIFVSNIPQGIAGTLSLQAAGTAMPRIIGMWTVLTLLCAAMAALGYAVADEVPDQGLYAEAFAAGAVLTMLADSMMPEGFEHGGKTVGLLTVFGFFVAGVLTVLD
jgi:ZIP family zinc transporter